jgi:hypothetical protein
MSFSSPMKGRSVMTGVASAAVLSVMLAAAPAFAQAPAAAPAPEQAAQAPAQPAPAPAPAQTAPPPAAAPAPVVRPFPEGAKYAFVNIQRIASESNEGKASTAKVQALNQQKVNELNEMNKALQAVQQKLEAGGGIVGAG